VDKFMPPLSASEYVYRTHPEQTLMPVRMLGNIRRAGLYHVPTNLDLYTLLSLAGGYGDKADLAKISVLRKKPKGELRHYTLDLTNPANEKELYSYSMAPEDVVFVRSKEPFIDDSTMRLISVVSVILSAVLTTVVISDRL
jgi:hypothetical protein